jgi:hypothetical protein
MASIYPLLVSSYCDHADTCVDPDGTMYILASHNEDLVLLKVAPSTNLSTPLVPSFIAKFAHQFQDFCKFGLGASIALVDDTLYCYVPVETAEKCGDPGEEVCLYLIPIPLSDLVRE